jgi:hypothetical protein
VVPKLPVIEAAERPALVIVTMNAATASRATPRHRAFPFNFIQFI